VFSRTIDPRITTRTVVTGSSNEAQAASRDFARGDMSRLSSIADTDSGSICAMATARTRYSGSFGNATHSTPAMSAALSTTPKVIATTIR